MPSPSAESKELPGEQNFADSLEKGAPGVGKGAVKLETSENTNGSEQPLSRQKRKKKWERQPTHPVVNKQVPVSLGGGETGNRLQLTWETGTRREKTIEMLKKASHGGGGRSEKENEQGSRNLHLPIEREIHGAPNTQKERGCPKLKRKNRGAHDARVGKVEEQQSEKVGGRQQNRRGASISKRWGIPFDRSEKDAMSRPTPAPGGRGTMTKKKPNKEGDPRSKGKQQVSLHSGKWEKIHP